MLVVEEAEVIAREFLDSQNQSGLRMELVTVSLDNTGMPSWKIVFDTYGVDDRRVDPPVMVRINPLHREASYLR